MKQFFNLIYLILVSIFAFLQHIFNPVTQSVGLEVNSQNLGQAVGWGDIDNDGDLDLAYSYSNPAEFKLYRNEGGMYGDITNSSGLAGTGAWTIIWTVRYLRSN